MCRCWYVLSIILLTQAYIYFYVYVYGYIGTIYIYGYRVTENQILPDSS